MRVIAHALVLAADGGREERARFQRLEGKRVPRRGAARRQIRTFPVDRSWSHVRTSTMVCVKPVALSNPLAEIVFPAKPDQPCGGGGGMPAGGTRPRRFFRIESYFARCESVSSWRVSS